MNSMNVIVAALSVLVIAVSVGAMNLPNAASAGVGLPLDEEDGVITVNVDRPEEGNGKGDDRFFFLSCHLQCKFECLTAGNNSLTCVCNTPFGTKSVPCTLYG